MDIWLLNYVNQTLAHPLLDGLMIAFSTVGFLLLPALALFLLARVQTRRLGMVVLIAFVVSLLLTLIFQALTMRPRPEMVRLLLPQPGVASFPSGHAACAFAVVITIGLQLRRGWWWVAGLTIAGLIAASRVYLGHHYPSDVFGGMVLGSAVGSAAYGLSRQPQPAWRWLLWPQVAIVIVVSQVAYLGFLPYTLLRWPLADKVMHFVLFGSVVFWLNLWLDGKRWQWGRLIVPAAILLPMTLALVEEGIQHFSPLRSADPFDLLSDLLGMIFFWLLSEKFRRWQADAVPPQPVDEPALG